MKNLKLIVVGLMILITTKSQAQFYYTLDSLITSNDEVSNYIKSCTTEVCPRANMSLNEKNNGMVLKQYYRVGDKVKPILKTKYIKVSRSTNGNIISTVYMNKEDASDIIYSKFNLNNFSETFDFMDGDNKIYATYYFSLTKKEYLCLKENYYETVKNK
jgi:hypothetical protein